MSSIVIYAEKKVIARNLIESFKIKEEHPSYIELEACSRFPEGAIITWGYGVTFIMGVLIELEQMNEVETQVMKRIYNEESIVFQLNNLGSGLTIKDLENAYGKSIDNTFSEHLKTVKALFQNAKTLINVSEGVVLNTILFDMHYSLADSHDKNILHYPLNSLSKDVLKENWKKELETVHHYQLFESKRLDTVVQYLQSKMKSQEKETR